MSISASINRLRRALRWSGVDWRDDDSVRSYVLEHDDVDLLSIDNLGSGTVATLRAWASGGDGLPNWVGEGTP